LDGIRACAVAGVLVFHARPDWLRGGFLGVDAFFVVSGFLITGLCWPSGSGPAGSGSARSGAAAPADRHLRLLAKVATASPARPHILDLNKLVCPDGKFTWSINGLRVRGDGLHFTPARRPAGDRTLAAPPARHVGQLAMSG